MKKFVLLLLSALLMVSLSVGICAAASENGETAPFANSLTVSDQAAHDSNGGAWGVQTLPDGTACGESIQIKMNTSLTAGYFQKTQNDGNHFTHIALYTKIAGDADYAWHTLGELNGVKDSGGLSYISEVCQRGDMLVIRFESMWGAKEFSPLDVKAVKLMQGMQWLVQKPNLDGDQWNNYPNGGAGIPSADTGVNEDIVLQFTKYYNGTDNDTFIPYSDLSGEDTLTVKTQPAKLNYAIGETFDASGLVLEATVGGNAQEVPVYASMVSVENKTFTETGEQKVTVSYGGKNVEIAVTVTDLPLDHIAITQMPSKTVYTAGEEFDKAGMAVTAYPTETDEDGRVLDASVYTVSGYDATVVGEQTLTVTYMNQTATFKITVNAPEMTNFIDFDTNVWPYHNISETSEVNGVQVGHTLEIKLTVQQPNYLYGTDKKTNQGTHIELYAKIKGSDEYAWYTVQQLTEMKDSNGMPYIARVAQREQTLILYFDTFYGNEPTKEFTPLNVKAIKLKAGMQWAAQYGSANWTDGGEDAIMPGDTGVKDNIILQIEQLYHGNASATSCDIFSYYYESVDSLTVKTQPDKRAYLPGEVFEPAGMVLQATKNGETFDVNGTASMVLYDGAPLENGDTSIDVSWGGKTVSIAIEVTPEIDHIAVASAPAKTEYGLGEVLVPDLTGLVVKAYAANDTEGWTVANSELTISGYDMTVADTYSVEVTYRNFKTSFEITVSDNNPDSRMTFYHGSPIQITDQAGTLSVRFNFENITVKTGFWSLYKVDAVSNVKDKVFLQVSDLYKGDKLEVGEWYSVGELMNVYDGNNMPYIARASQFGESLVLHLDTYFGGSEPSLEFTRECVSAMRLEEGLFFVEYITNNWGDQSGWENNLSSYTMIPNAILRDTVEIEMNIVGTSWLRPFKEDANGNMAEDALVVKTMPNKTQYAVGDDFDPTGLVLHAKYRDGGEEDIAITDRTVCSYDFSEEGKAIVTVNFNDGSVTLGVNVGEDDPSSQPGGGCSGAAGFGGIALLSCMAIAACVLLIARKRTNR